MQSFYNKARSRKSCSFGDIVFQDGKWKNNNTLKIPNALLVTFRYSETIQKLKARKKKDFFFF